MYAIPPFLCCGKRDRCIYISNVVTLPKPSFIIFMSYLTDKNSVYNPYNSNHLIEFGIPIEEKNSFAAIIAVENETTASFATAISSSIEFV